MPDGTQARFAGRTDEELVQALQRAGTGDLRAFDELVARHQGKVMANCRYMTRASADSEDLAQEVFVRAFFGLKNFRRDAQFGTWLRRIKVNHCLNYLKKKSRRPDEVDIESPGVAAHESVRREARGAKGLEALDEKARIEIVLDGLSETLRVPLLMRDLDELSYQEIADELGLGLSAAKMRVKRGREAFRAAYEAMFGGRGVPDAPEGTMSGGGGD